MRRSPIPFLLSMVCAGAPLHSQQAAVSVGSGFRCAMIASHAQCAEWNRPFHFMHGMMPLPGDPGLVSIVAGNTFACGLTAGGALYCLGDNTRANAAPFTVESDAVPCYQQPATRCSDHLIRVAAPLTFASIGIGRQTMCGVTPGGKVWCWGNNENGQTGAPQRRVLNHPFAVAPSQSFSQVVVGDEHACALTTAGRVWCWGSNFVPYLGLGMVDSSDHGRSPAPVAGGKEFTSLSASSTITCGLVADGAAWCWGENPEKFAFSPATPTCDVAGRPACFLAVPGAVVPDFRFRALSAGDGHLCGITPGGDAVCWGSNGSGKLGIGQGWRAVPGSTRPVPIGGGHRFSAVAAGTEATCGIARDSFYCWGRTNSDDAQQETLLPEPVPPTEPDDETRALFTRWRVSAAVATTPAVPGGKGRVPPRGLPHP